MEDELESVTLSGDDWFMQGWQNETNEQLRALNWYAVDYK